MDTPRDRVIRISAAVIVDEQDRILLVRKRGTTVFMQPGGKMYPGETALAAVEREVFEELGVGVTDARPLGRHVARAANEPDHVVDADLFAVKLVGEPRAASEIEELLWLDPDAPGDVDIAPLTTQAVLTRFGK